LLADDEQLAFERRFRAVVYNNRLGCMFSANRSGGR
jgi:hypothetical protein